MSTATETRRGITVDTPQGPKVEFANATNFVYDDSGQLAIFEGADLVAVFADRCWLHVRMNVPAS